MSTWILNAMGNFIRTDYMVLYKNRNDIREYRGFAALNPTELRVLDTIIRTPEDVYRLAQTLHINHADRTYEWRPTNDNNQANASGNVRECRVPDVSSFGNTEI